MRLFIDYDFPNWNEYIYIERTNKYKANRLKQEEKELVRFLTFGKKYTGNYPVEIIFRPHFKDHKRDLDNYRIKGILDGLVTCKVIKNDNLNYIQRIILEPTFDKKIGVEIEIRELKKEERWENLQFQ